MFTLPRIRDNSRQQRPGRTNGAIRSTLDRRPMGEDPPLAAEKTQVPARRAATGKRPQSSGRHSLDFCAAVLAGKTCPRNSRHRQRAGGGFGIGKSKGFGSPFGAHFWPNSTNASNSTGANRFSTAVSLRRKKGLESRKNQAGQGHEVDGGGRRRGCSFGKAALLCFPERSPARGRNARVGPRDPAAARRAATPKNATGHRRPRL